MRSLLEYKHGQLGYMWHWHWQRGSKI